MASGVKKYELRETVVNLSYGVIATVIDLSLFIVSLQYYSLKEGLKTSVAKATERAFNSALEDVLALGIDKEAVKRAFWKISNKRLIKRGGKSRNFLQITEAGLARLNQKLPVYKEKRVWDTRLYLITYDIPEEAKGKREILRECLKELNCGMLQESVWLTPYNPKGVLKNLVSQYHLPGSIIISDVGKDGSIGDEDLDDLISRVYHLDEINEKYEQFIQRLRKGGLNKIQAYFQFLSVLKEDPQLPFEILPYNWLGDKACRCLQEKYPS